MALARLLVPLLATTLAVPAILAARGWYSLRGRIDRLEARVEALSDEAHRRREERAEATFAPLAALVRAAATSPVVRAALPHAAVDDGPVAVATPPEAPIPEQSEQLEDQFAWQAYDRPWAERTQSELSDAFKYLSELGGELRPPECRSSMCKVGVVVREQKQVVAVANHLMGKAPSRDGDSMGLLEERAADGSTTLVLFLVRPRRS